MGRGCFRFLLFARSCRWPLTAGRRAASVLCTRGMKSRAAATACVQKIPCTVVKTRRKAQESAHNEFAAAALVDRKGCDAGPSRRTHQCGGDRPNNTRPGVRINQMKGGRGKRGPPLCGSKREEKTTGGTRTVRADCRLQSTTPLAAPVTPASLLTAPPAAAPLTRAQSRPTARPRGRPPPRPASPARRRR